ncbi:hypothetical protein R1flu_005465 [Riccia fluitans]|uniref:Uncharacterized protein n=1 Tax=Riccia fluitans TaxID=41844 RepID=A0ABD1YT92_9MARC
MRDATWRSGKINIRDKCTNVFLKNNWLAWRKQCQPEYNPNKAEVRKAMLHYTGLEMHGVKVDWSIVDISLLLNTISREMRMSARRELYRMKVKMDGKLVEPFDPDELERPRKIVRSNPLKKSDVPLPPMLELKHQLHHREKRRWKCSLKMHSKMKCGRNFVN